MNQARIIKVEDRSTGEEGYRVRLMILPGSDELWEVLDHFTVFRSKARASSLLDRLKRSGYQFNKEFWIWTPSNCSPYAFIQENPTASDVWE